VAQFVRKRVSASAVSATNVEAGGVIAEVAGSLAPKHPEAESWATSKRSEQSPVHLWVAGPRFDTPLSCLRLQESGSTARTQVVASGWGCGSGFAKGIGLLLDDGRLTSSAPET